MAILINSLKEQAVQVLLKEAFSHIHKNIYEGHVSIAYRNAQLHNKTTNYFIYGGTIYPNKSPNGTIITNIKVVSLPLHYSLFDDFDIVNGWLNDSGYSYIKNYFIAVMNHSFNSIVLDELLPGILVNKLKHKFAVVDFDLINKGVFGNKIVETISDTKKNIADIKEHYVEVIIILRKLLMDSLLLQE